MDTKFKVAAIIFLVVIVGFALYFVLADMTKQKQTEREEKKLIERFEDYDVRKAVLNYLDQHTIDKKTKTAVYNFLNTDIERFKEYPEQKLKDYIKDIIPKVRKTMRLDNDDDSSTPKKKEKENEPDPPTQKEKEKYEEDPDESTEEFAAADSSTTEKDIQAMLDVSMNHVNTLEKHITHIKTMVTGMAKECSSASASASKKSIPPPPVDTPKMQNVLPEMEQTKKSSLLSNKKEDVIEGFENFSGRGYSFL